MITRKIGSNINPVYSNNVESINKKEDVDKLVENKKQQIVEKNSNDNPEVKVEIVTYSRYMTEDGKPYKSEGYLEEFNKVSSRLSSGTINGRTIWDKTPSDAIRDMEAKYQELKENILGKYSGDEQKSIWKH